MTYSRAYISKEKNVDYVLSRLVADVVKSCRLGTYSSREAVQAEDIF